MRIKRRNRIVVLLLAPILAVLWIIGWSLYWIGTQKQPKRPRVQIQQVMGGCSEHIRRCKSEQE